MKGNTELRDEVQETLFEMLDDGTFARIAEEWELSDNVCLSREETATEVSVSQTADKKKANIGEICLDLLPGIGSSLLIFVLTLLFSLPLGLLFALGNMSKIKPLHWIISLYISIMRGTPLMLQLLVVFFGPYFVFGIQTPAGYRFWAVIIGFVLNYSAYFAEIYRGGIQAVPKGQREAAKILGYSKFQTDLFIIFPQMIRVVLPSVTNEVITLVKDTSLAFAISYAEMFTLAKQTAASNTSVLPLFIAGGFYFIFNFVVALVMKQIEKKMALNK
ncbi:MAG: ABC transporter substrate-binding protein/permease [Oscillospiraceae bacterium]|nr:ABC transporter substrate-binding protein/permease [Oscillospiraceae bacterium]